jgi:hypothetical protein
MHLVHLRVSLALLTAISAGCATAAGSRSAPAAPRTNSTVAADSGGIAAVRYRLMNTAFEAFVSAGTLPDSAALTEIRQLVGAGAARLVHAQASEDAIRDAERSLSTFISSLQEPPSRIPVRRSRGGGGRPSTPPVPPAGESGSAPVGAGAVHTARGRLCPIYPFC